MGSVLEGAPLLMQEERLREAVRAAQEALDRASAALEEQGTSDDLGAAAARHFRERRKRDEAFPPGLFVEPEWDMLLVLAKAHGEGRELRQIEVLNAINVPHTTGFRVIQRLEEAGLVTRTALEQVRRSNVVRLTEEGVRRLTAALSATTSAEVVAETQAN
jgi:DNA-binding MarR family transcriptional regulator